VTTAESSGRPKFGDLNSPLAFSFDIAVPASTKLSTLRDEIAAGIAMAFRETAARRQDVSRRDAPSTLLPNFTAREREVLQLILEGFPNKNIAADLGISMRTVEHHRAAIMKKSGCRSLPALVRLALAAGDTLAAPAARI
jgi:DNA-binding NarL/FixJ family response regulator